MYYPTLPVETVRYKSLLEQKIKEAASRKPIDINDLATASGVNESTLYSLFKKGSGRIDTLKKIADALGIDVKTLLPENKSKTSQQLQSQNQSKDVAVPKSKGQTAQLYLHELPEKDAESYIPYYDVEITAGQIELYFGDAEEVPEGYIYAPQYKDCIGCRVSGDSMYDKIFPGSRLYIYHLKNKKYIDFGQIYLIVLDGFRLLKYIVRDPNDETCVILRSYNRHYDDWKIEKADILHLFLVKGYETQNAI